MIKFLNSLMFFSLLGLSGASWADPIGDGALDTYEAGWFPSAGQSCREACARRDLVAEHERLAIPSLGVQHTTACKARVRGPGYSGQAYGNNLLGEKYSAYCIIALGSGQTLFRDHFQCLCLGKRG